MSTETVSGKQPEGDLAAVLRGLDVDMRRVTPPHRPCVQTCHVVGGSMILILFSLLFFLDKFWSTHPRWVPRPGRV